MTPMVDQLTRLTLMAEIYRAFKNLDAPAELLAIIGSIGDTLDDKECLGLLKDYNETGNYLYTKQ